MKSTLKKVLFSLGAIGLVRAGSAGMVSAQQAQNGGTFGKQNLEGKVDSNVIRDVDDDGTGKTSLIGTIKTFVNRVLGMLSLIALCICLRGGFQMLTASGDETKYKKGFTILKQAALGLVVVGLARLFVSLIFWLINNQSTSGSNSATV